MGKDIKIFMCTHKAFEYLPPLAVAVQGGAKLKPPVPGAVPDYGAGGSISEKNPEYCELTVQYYAWKNEIADYYGFCHYRRFFSTGKGTPVPYLAFGKLSEKKKSELLMSDKDISDIVSGYDVVVPRAEDMGCTVYEQYASSAHCYAEDMELFVSILKKRYPYLSGHADEYLSQNKQYFCNMFIMKKDLFFGYCEHLFALLEEFDTVKVRHGSFQSDRTDGYLAERFLGIYLSYLRAGGASAYECVRVDVDCALSKRISYTLLPPESKRRMLLKRLLGRSGKRTV